MRKVLAVALAGVTALSLAACGPRSTTTTVHHTTVPVQQVPLPQRTTYHQVAPAPRRTVVVRPAPRTTCKRALIRNRWICK